jgi:hypothetical protein
MRSVSLRTLNIRGGTRERRMTMMNVRVLDKGIVVDCRIRSGIGRGGVVMRIDGIADSRVTICNNAIPFRSRNPGPSYG